MIEHSILCCEKSFAKALILLAHVSVCTIKEHLICCALTRVLLTIPVKRLAFLPVAGTTTSLCCLTYKLAYFNLYVHLVEFESLKQTFHRCNRNSIEHEWMWCEV